VIHFTAAQGNLAILKVLIEQAVDIHAIDEETHCTALHFAVLKNRRQIVQYLLNHHADPNCVPIVCE
jgi:ankyrin repeat protein